MKHTYLGILLSLIVVIGLAPTALGLSLLDEVKDEVAPVADIEEKVRKRVDEARQRVEERKQTYRTSQSGRLNDQRMQECLKRQNRINVIVEQQTVEARDNLSVYTKVQERLDAFYTTSRQPVASYQDMATQLEQSYINAKTAIEVAASTPFLCEYQNPSQPIGIHVRQAVTGVGESLSIYKDDIKSLLELVKKAEPLPVEAIRPDDEQTDESEDDR